MSIGVLDFDSIFPEPTRGSAEVHRQYTEHQQAERRRLIGLIEAEKIEFHRRINPYLEELCRIESRATPVIVIKTGLR